VISSLVKSCGSRLQVTSRGSRLARASTPTLLANIVPIAFLLEELLTLDFTASPTAYQIMSPVGLNAKWIAKENQ